MSTIRDNSWRQQSTIKICSAPIVSASWHTLYCQISPAYKAQKCLCSFTRYIVCWSLWGKFLNLSRPSVLQRSTDANIPSKYQCHLNDLLSDLPPLPGCRARWHQLWKGKGKCLKGVHGSDWPLIVLCCKTIGWLKSAGGVTGWHSLRNSDYLEVVLFVFVLALLNPLIWRKFAEANLNVRECEEAERKERTGSVSTNRLEKTVTYRIKNLKKTKVFLFPFVFQEPCNHSILSNAQRYLASPIL